LVYEDQEEQLETAETQDRLEYREIEVSLVLLVLMERWDQQVE